MKNCPWCGQEYPDEVTVCPTDQNSLERPQAPVTAPADRGRDKLVERPAPPDEDAIPDGYLYCGTYDPMEAERFLQKFTDGGVRFLIDRIQTEALTTRYRLTDWIQIYIHEGDEQKANQIITADVKL
jgi:hypothetical protein